MSLVNHLRLHWRLSDKSLIYITNGSKSNKELWETAGLTLTRDELTEDELCPLRIPLFFSFIRKLLEGLKKFKHSVFTVLFLACWPKQAIVRSKTLVNKNPRLPWVNPTISHIRNGRNCTKTLCQILANKIENGGRGIGLRIYVRYCLKKWIQNKTGFEKTLPVLA